MEHYRKGWRQITEQGGRSVRALLGTFKGILFASSRAHIIFLIDPLIFFFNSTQSTLLHNFCSDEWDPSHISGPWSDIIFTAKRFSVL